MKVYIGWDEVEDYIRQLGDTIYNYYRDDIDARGIFTFPKGGLVLATMLANYMEYKYKWNLPILTNPVYNCIIIDDILDTGITYEKYSKLKLKEKYFTSFMYVQNKWLGPDNYGGADGIEFYYGRKDDTWLVFPWEMEDKEND